MLPLEEEEEEEGDGSDGCEDETSQKGSLAVTLLPSVVPRETAFHESPPAPAAFPHHGAPFIGEAAGAVAALLRSCC